jgi:valyl-tRNA synthetase
MNVPAGAQIPLLLIGAGPRVAKRVEVWGETIRRLARLSSILVASEVPPHSVQILARDSMAALPLRGVVDFAAEKVRLGKEIAKLKSEAEKLTAKLGNADFLRRAPEDVVEEQRDRLAEAESRRAKLETALSRLAA